MKKCETFGCSNPGSQMYQIAPGTNVWLCQACLQAAKIEDQVSQVPPPAAPRKAA